MRNFWRACQIGLLGILLSSPARADSQAGNWALAQVKQTGVANFDDNCQKYGSTTPGLKLLNSPPPEAKTSLLVERHVSDWILPCRTITSSQFLAILASGAANISLAGVNIEPDDPSRDRVDISQRDFKTRLTIKYARISRRFYLDAAHFVGLDIDNTDVLGAINAEDISVDDDLKLDNLHFKYALDLAGSRISTSMKLAALYCETCSVGGTDLHVGGNFYIENTMDAGPLDLSNSIFDRSLRFLGTIATSTEENPDKTVRCNSCLIAGDLTFGSYSEGNSPHSRLQGLVDFSKSHIAGTINTSDSEFDQGLTLDDAVIDNINIGAATAINQLEIENSEIAGSLRIGTPPDRDTNTQIGDFYLNDTTIDRQLDLSGLHGKASWSFIDPAGAGRMPPTLDLTNTNVGSFTDCRDSWPDHVKIDSFDYGKIYRPNDPQCSSIFAETPSGEESDAGWLGWLQRYDPATPPVSDAINHQSGDTGEGFDPQPYIYMAKFFGDQGYESWSDDILFAEKQIETRQDLANCRNILRQQTLFLERSTKCLSGAAAWTFGLLAGYGLSEPGFLHIFWVTFASIVAGFIVLSFSPKARAHSVLWRIGACFEQLLPVVELRQEFRDFFNGPDNNLLGPKLNGFQKFFFVVYSLWGWLIGFWLVAMLSGVTKGS